MPVWLAPLFGILAKAAEPLIEWFRQNAEKIGFYFKGRSDQRAQDDLARLRREGEESSRAYERTVRMVEEARRTADPDGTDLYRVRGRDRSRSPDGQTPDPPVPRPGA